MASNHIRFSRAVGPQKQKNSAVFPPAGCYIESAHGWSVYLSFLKLCLRAYFLTCTSKQEGRQQTAKQSFSGRASAGTMKLWHAWILAIALLVASGIIYRLLASHMNLVVRAPITLPVPLNSFPNRIGYWSGTDLAIRTTTREYMERNFADDFMSRRYISSEKNIWADVYIVYCSSRPGGILGHRPGVCYPAHGWIHDSVDRSQFRSRAGRQVDCLVNRFHKPAPAYEQTVVLNFYILNGQLTADEDDFSGPLGRRPNIARDPARYVAQVQISSVLENSVRTAAADMTDTILDFFPDKDGQVRATGLYPTAGSALR